jgi:hypothetical protein
MIALDRSSTLQRFSFGGEQLIQQLLTSYRPCANIATGDLPASCQQKLGRIRKEKRSAEGG